MSEEEKTNEEIREEGKSEKKEKSRKNKKPRLFPQYTLEDALGIAKAIKEHNAGNPWDVEQVAKALNYSYKSTAFYYWTTASRDYGLTTGTSKSQKIELTSLGRKLVYPEDKTEEHLALVEAFLNIDIFKKVQDYYHDQLPEKVYLFNTLQETFKLDPIYHEEFLDIYTRGLEFLNKRGVEPLSSNANGKETSGLTVKSETPESHNNKEVFVIMPFSEKTGKYPEGFFSEVFNSLIVPAAAEAGYTAVTANKSGSDIIQKTIVSSIFNADIILADLTEHNPNVLFELGLAIAFKKNVVIIRAKGTAAIFDIDNAMRVLDYNSNLWKSTLEMDVEKLSKHILSAVDNVESDYLDIFLKN